MRRFTTKAKLEKQGKQFLRGSVSHKVFLKNRWDGAMGKGAAQ
jgi:hypothetical protein